MSSDLQPESWQPPLRAGHSAFSYVFEGEGAFGIAAGDDGEQVSSPRLVVFDDGDEVRIRALGCGVRFLLISGKPLNEPAARYGPFVMNTKAEIEQALLDLRRGTFVRSRAPTVYRAASPVGVPVRGHPVR